MEVSYKPSFLRTFKKLPRDLQDDVYTAIELFKEKRNHERLRVHKLKGELKGLCSLSVNHTHRIIFEMEHTDSAAFLTI